MKHQKIKKKKHFWVVFFGYLDGFFFKWLFFAKRANNFKSTSLITSKNICFILINEPFYVVFITKFSLKHTKNTFFLGGGGYGQPCLVGSFLSCSKCDYNATRPAMLKEWQCLYYWSIWKQGLKYELAIGQFWNKLKYWHVIGPFQGWLVKIRF